jgi:hypothetical protein
MVKPIADFLFWIGLQPDIFPIQPSDVGFLKRPPAHRIGLSQNRFKRRGQSQDNSSPSEFSAFTRPERHIHGIRWIWALAIEIVHRTPR